ncbi:hypothetical protein GCM10027445_01440 [Amycolatopsis endophytica]|uniref:Uncharacterized protein YjbJ (UPF0337 family) n=1 Tax=Amycolatopsis endophytica TaxID=860233 RepID=A0A853B9W6_9PSEU|nr:CsbD family protein [Amycolatopsis endophytica]NYI91517.1 uncharacterized protein YjbJ (UPF0337 family) [Amycolatopsis endophytica]
MSLGDKIGTTAENLTGKAKEAAGAATGDERLRGEGKADQAKAGIKEAVRDAADTIKGALNKD